MAHTPRPMWLPQTRLVLGQTKYAFITERIKYSCVIGQRPVGRRNFWCVAMEMEIGLGECP